MSQTPKNFDRYIPLRHSSQQHDEAHQSLVNPSEETSASKILAFKNKAPVASHKVLFKQSVSRNEGYQLKKQTNRVIPSTAESCLDAPNLKPDFYLNLVDWSSENVLAIALGHQVFLWNAESAAISELAHKDESCPDWTSVAWASRGSYLALGTTQGVVEIHDASIGKRLRKMDIGESRVPVAQWSPSMPYLLASACANEVVISDVRARNHKVGSLSGGHFQEICGLKWSPNGTQIATGGNDNLLCVWDVSASNMTPAPKFVLKEHSAGVKAVAWCPWQPDLLASGGGNADRHIRFWNTTTGAMLNCIDTGSQISSLQWSSNPACKEIVSTHGYLNCEVNVWKYPSLAKVGELKGHRERILSSCVSPDGRTVCTAAADETLRFWNVWPARTQTKKKTEKTVSSSITQQKKLR